MKKALLVLIMVMAAALLFAETHTIVLVSRVEKKDAQFVIRNNETGAIGASVVYSTREIAKGDVSTSFDIIQSCDSNGIDTVNFKVSATELRAMVNGRLYSTNGVSILMNGRQYGSEVSFTRTTTGVVAAGTEVASFNVVWPTSAELVPATYEASVTLTATAR